MKQVILTAIALLFSIHAIAAESTQWQSVWKSHPQTHYINKDAISIVYGGEDVQKINTVENVLV